MWRNDLILEESHPVKLFLLPIYNQLFLNVPRMSVGPSATVIPLKWPKHCYRGNLVPHSRVVWVSQGGKGSTGNDIMPRRKKPWVSGRASRAPPPSGKKTLRENDTKRLVERPEQLRLTTCFELWTLCCAFRSLPDTSSAVKLGIWLQLFIHFKTRLEEEHSRRKSVQTPSGSWQTSANIFLNRNLIA